MISYGRQSIGQDDIDSVVDVLKSDWLTQGPVLEKFEKEFAKKVNAKYAVAVCNGTAALHLSCLAAGLKKNEIAVTSALTFVATANAPIYCGASTNFVDIDSSTLGLCIDSLKKYLSKETKTKVILPVHYAGLSCNMTELKHISGGRVIIEDASHALGGIYENGMPVGSCINSDMTIFSFHPVKPITTGEGGVVTTNDIEIASKIKMLRSHGIEKNKEVFVCQNDRENECWYYEQQELGFNYRLSDIHAALGLTQLKKLDSFIKRRREIASYYDSRLKNVDGLMLYQSSDENRERSGLHIYTIGIEYKKYKTSRQTIMEKLRSVNINTQVHYIPVYRQPFHASKKMSFDNFHNTENYYEKTLSIPFYPDLTDAQVEHVADSIKDILK